MCAVLLDDGLFPLCHLFHSLPISYQSSRLFESHGYSISAPTQGKANTVARSNIILQYCWLAVDPLPIRGVWQDWAMLAANTRPKYIFLIRLKGSEIAPYFHLSSIKAEEEQWIEKYSQPLTGKVIFLPNILKTERGGAEREGGKRKRDRMKGEKLS